MKRDLMPDRAEGLLTEAKRLAGTAGLPVPAVAARGTADSVAGGPDHWTNKITEMGWQGRGASPTRGDLDVLHARIADETGAVHDEHEELAELAWLLLYELEQMRMRDGLVRSAYAGLLGAARATVAACGRGEADPLVYLRHELDRYGQLPPAGAAPAQLLADAAGTAALLAQVG